MTVDRVIAAAAAVYGVTEADIRSRSRRQPVAEARQVAAYVTRHETGASYPTLGRLFGRHHTTILYAIEQVERLRWIDEAFDEPVRAIETIIETTGGRR